MKELVSFFRLFSSIVQIQFDLEAFIIYNITSIRCLVENSVEKQGISKFQQETRVLI